MTPIATVLYRESEIRSRVRELGETITTDYAGRSLKGQLTQAGRLGARLTVVVGAAAATLRTAGTQDVEIPLDELEERLTA